MIKLDIYTDASGNLKSKNFGYSAVFEYEEKEYFHSHSINQEQLQSIIPLKELVVFSNPTVEVFAVVELFASLLELSDEQNLIHIPLDITVFSDYKGVSCWYKREWAINEDHIRKVMKLCWRFSDILKERGSKINIVWIKGHNGDRLNERADKLAGQRLNETTIPEFITKLKEYVNSRISNTLVE